MIRSGQVGSESIRELSDDEADKINLRTINTWWSQLFRHPDGPAFPDDVSPVPDERISIDSPRRGLGTTTSQSKPLTRKVRPVVASAFGWRG